MLKNPITLRIPAEAGIQSEWFAGPSQRVGVPSRRYSRFLAAG